MSLRLYYPPNHFVLKPVLETIVHSFEPETWTDPLTPILVQILTLDQLPDSSSSSSGTAAAVNGQPGKVKLAATIYDTYASYNLCVLELPLHRMYDPELTVYSVIRLEQYRVVMRDTKEDTRVPVFCVRELVVVKPGVEIYRRLNIGEMVSLVSGQRPELTDLAERYYSLICNPLLKEAVRLASGPWNYNIEDGGRYSEVSPIRPRRGSSVTTTIVNTAGIDGTTSGFSSPATFFGTSSSGTAFGASSLASGFVGSSSSSGISSSQNIIVESSGFSHMRITGFSSEAASGPSPLGLSSGSSSQEIGLSGFSSVGHLGRSGSSSFSQPMRSSSGLSSPVRSLGFSSVPTSEPSPGTSSSGLSSSQPLGFSLAPSSGSSPFGILSGSSPQQTGSSEFAPMGSMGFSSEPASGNSSETPSGPSPGTSSGTTLNSQPTQSSSNHSKESLLGSPFESSGYSSFSSSEPFFGLSSPPSSSSSGSGGSSSLGFSPILSSGIRSDSFYGPTEISSVIRTSEGSGASGFSFGFATMNTLGSSSFGVGAGGSSSGTSKQPEASSSHTETSGPSYASPLTSRPTSRIPRPTTSKRFSQFLPSLRDVMYASKGSTVNVLGIIHIVGPIETFVRKHEDMKNMRKQEITIVDQSNTAVVVNIWNAQLESVNLDGGKGSVLALWNAYVGEYRGGHTLSMNYGTAYEVNPRLEESKELIRWYWSEQNTGQYTELIVPYLGQKQ